MPEKNSITEENRSEILYKLGAIEARIEMNSHNWVGPVKKIEELLEKLDDKIDRDIIALKTDVINNKKEIQTLSGEIEKWKAKVTTAVAAVSVFWIVFGDNITNIFNKAV